MIMLNIQKKAAIQAVKRRGILSNGESKWMARRIGTEVENGDEDSEGEPDGLKVGAEEKGRSWIVWGCRDWFWVGRGGDWDIRR